MAWRKGQKNKGFPLEEAVKEYLREVVAKTLETDEPDPYFYHTEFKAWAVSKGVEFYPGELGSALTALVRKDKVAVLEGAKGIMFMITGH